MPTQSGYDVDYQVKLALGLVHSCKIDEMEFNCVFSIPATDDEGYSRNAAQLVVATQHLAALTLLDGQSIVSDINAPEADASDIYRVAHRERGSAGKTMLRLERHGGR